MCDLFFTLNDYDTQCAYTCIPRIQTNHTHSFGFENSSLHECKLLHVFQQYLLGSIVRIQRQQGGGLRRVWQHGEVQKWMAELWQHYRLLIHRYHHHIQKLLHHGQFVSQLFWHVFLYLAVDCLLAYSYDCPIPAIFSKLLIFLSASIAMYVYMYSPNYHIIYE